MAYSTYSEDRIFTNKMHKLAIEKIYTPLGLIEIKPTTEAEKELANLKDCYQGIDYRFVKTKNNETREFIFQERFRRNGGNDFTLRYKREENEDETQYFSEFYKLKSAIKKSNQNYFLLYGIINEEESDFVKYVIINLNKLYAAIDAGQIIIDDNLSGYSKMSEDKSILYAAVNKNKDFSNNTTYSSSSFVVFDVRYLVNYFNGIVSVEYGFMEKAQHLATDKQIYALNKISKDKGLQLYNTSQLNKTEARVLFAFLNDSNLIPEEVKDFIKDPETAKIVVKYLR